MTTGIIAWTIWFAMWSVIGFSLQRQIHRARRFERGQFRAAVKQERELLIDELRQMWREVRAGMVPPREGERR